MLCVNVILYLSQCVTSYSAVCYLCVQLISIVFLPFESHPQMHYHMDYSFLQECDASVLDIWFPAFRGEVVASCRSVQHLTYFSNIFTLKMRPLRCFETSVSDHPLTRHVPEEGTHQLRSCASRKTSTRIQTL